MLDQRGEIAELVDQVQPVGLDGIAFTGRRIGEELLQVARIHERLARTGGADEVIDTEFVEIRRSRSEAVDACENIVESETPRETIEGDRGVVNRHVQPLGKVRLEHENNGP